MFDLMALAFQSDITRVFTFMMAREVSQRSYPQIGVPDPHHATSHHQDNPEKLAKLMKIKTYHVTLVRELPGQAESHAGRRRHFAGSLHVAVRQFHEQQQYPQSQSAADAAGGGGAGTLKGGRHLKYPENTPMSNLLLTVLNKVGVPTEKVGDSTSGLSDV